MMIHLCGYVIMTLGKPILVETCFQSNKNILLLLLTSSGSVDRLKLKHFFDLL